jgi:hypothetical protein
MGLFLREMAEMLGFSRADAPLAMRPEGELLAAAGGAAWAMPPLAVNIGPQPLTRRRFV